MDRISGENPMENPPRPPLAGLDPADLLRQGAAADTFVEGSSAFHPPNIEELATLFTQFEILSLIGQGGMGAVYQVRQKDLDRVVALKILPPAIGETAGFSDRFAREAKALARLNHPGIVTIHEFGRSEGFYFILMEFVDGVNLAQLMQSGRIASREALAIVPQICDALQYAHDQGIVHRDIKPENLLLDRLGRVKVADFGIAKIVGPVSSGGVQASACFHSADPQEDNLKIELPAYTEAGKIIGTPQYMAPEQIDHPSDVDHRADIYALGVVFYQMLTGELPGKELQAPSRKVSIDVRLDEMVLRALDSNPERRYKTADEFRTVVEGMLTSPPAAIPVKPTKYFAFLKWVGVGIICIFPVADASRPLLLLAGGGMVLWIFWFFIYIPYRAGFGQGRTNATEGHPSSPMKLVEQFFILLMIGILIILTFFAAVFGSEVWRSFQSARKQDSENHQMSGSPNVPAKLKGKPEESRVESPPSAEEPPSEAVANEYLDLVLNMATPTISGLGENHPRFVVDRKTLDRFKARYPQMPDKTCRKLASKRLLDLEEKKQRLVDNGIGEEHPLLRGLQAQIDALEEITIPKEPASEVGKPDMKTSVPKPVVITILGEGSVKVDDETFSLLDLSEELKRRVKEDRNVSVMIRGSAAVPYWKVVEIINLCQKIGVWNLSFSEDEKIKVDSVAGWLGKLDAGNYAECYSDSATVVKNTMSEEKWKQAMILFRAPLGAVVSRKLNKSKDVKQLPGVPDGEHRLMQFDTEFSNKKAAVETVVFTKDEDGVWKSCGYFIR